jgi:hypothetical protein
MIERYFRPQQSAILKKGLPYLLNAPDLHKWLGQRNEDMRIIFKTMSAQKRIERRLQEEDRRINDATAGLGALNEEQQKLDQEHLQANADYRQTGTQLGAQVDQAQERLFKESRFALLGFTNPLAGRVGRCIGSLATRIDSVATRVTRKFDECFGSWGQWGRRVLGSALSPVSVAVGAVAYIESAALSQSCATLSLQGAAQCVSTVSANSFLFPVAAAWGISKVCSWAYGKARSIFAAHAEVERLRIQIDAARISHKTQDEIFKQKKSELSEQTQKNTTAIEQAQKGREALMGQKSKFDTALEEIQQQVFNQVSDRTIGDIDTLVEAGMDPALKQQLVANNMMTVLDLFVASKAHRNDQLAALAGPEDDAGDLIVAGEVDHIGQ